MVCSKTDDSSSTNSYSDEEDSFDFSREHVSRQEIQKILGMRPKNIFYYQRALVHKSIQKNVRRVPRGEKVLDYYKESNERLEFVGDSVLGQVVSLYLYKKFPNDEGFLTRTKTKIVCGKSCARFAEILNLGEHLLMSKHVIKTNGKCNKKLLEDAFEAFIGAIELDLGPKFSKNFIHKLIENHIDFDELLEDNNYKDILLRYSQSKGLSLPKYEIVSEDGLSHQKIFTMEVIVDNIRLGRGKDTSKKGAEQNAAKKALDKIDSGELKGIINRDKYKN